MIGQKTAIVGWVAGLLDTWQPQLDGWLDGWPHDWINGSHNWMGGWVAGWKALMSGMDGCMAGRMNHSNEWMDWWLVCVWVVPPLSLAFPCVQTVFKLQPALC